MLGHELKLFRKTEHFAFGKPWHDDNLCASPEAASSNDASTCISYNSFPVPASAVDGEPREQACTKEGLSWRPWGRQDQS